MALNRFPEAIGTAAARDTVTEQRCHQRARPTAQQCGHEQLRPLVLVERCHSKRVADAERALGQGFDELRNPVQLRSRRPERHGRRHIDDHVHRHGRTLPADAHEPIAPQVSQTRTQIETARVRTVVQAGMRGELLAGTECRRGMRSGAPRTEPSR